MSELNYRNKETGKRAKVTIFSKEYAARKNHGRYFVALFNKDELTAKEENSWYCDVKRHAVGDAQNFVRSN